MEQLNRSVTSNQSRQPEVQSVIGRGRLPVMQEDPIDDRRGEPQLETINVDQLNLNNFLMQASVAFERGDLDAAYDLYSRGLQLLQKTNLDRTGEKAISLQTNMAVVLFYKNDYTRAASILQETLRQLRQQGRSMPEEVYSSLTIRSLANLCVVSIVNQRYEEAFQCNNEAIEVLREAREPRRKALLQELLYIYFRFTTFESISGPYAEVDERKYPKNVLGWYYTTMGINKELIGDVDNAIRYHSKAMEIWRGVNEAYLVVLALMHLYTLHRSVNNLTQAQEVGTVLNRIMDSEEFKNLSPELLFKDSDKRLSLAKELTNALQQVESSIAITAPQRSQLVADDLPNDFWKQALRLRLLNALKATKQLATGPRGSNQRERENLEMAARQIEETLKAMDMEQNELVLEKLRNSEYAKEASNIVRGNINRLRKFIVGLVYSHAWSRLRQVHIRHQKTLALESRKEDPNSFFGRAYTLATGGDYIIKVNLTSNSRGKKFLQLNRADGVIRWASSEDSIHSSKSRMYILNEVKGILYGKHTSTFKKDYNKKLEPWLCISLELHNRSLDLYFKEEQINPWYYVLSSEIKRQNPRAFAPSFGKFLWRKLQFLLFQFYLGPQIKTKKGKLSFAKAVVAYKFASANDY